ncbi:MAG: SMP-30/gluconolactonase/LRE family protein [Acidimicrobiales bacterium]
MRTARTLAEGFTFGEGPRWHDGRWWVSDFHDHAVKTVTVEGDVAVAVQLEDRPSGLGWLPDGRLLVVSMTRRQVLRCEPDGTVVVHADLSDVATFHCNDMVVDGAGRAWVGNFGFDLERYAARRAAGAREEAAAMRRTAALACVTPDGAVRVAAEGLEFPNGSVVTPDGATLIVAESLGQRLSAWTIAADGTLTDRRVWAELPGIAPDGICLDADGAVWVADAAGHGAVRVRVGGEIVDRVEVEDRCFACMLGGAEGTTLLLVTAATSEVDRARADRAGRVRVVEVDVPRAGWP